MAKKPNMAKVGENDALMERNRHQSSFVTLHNSTQLQYQIFYYYCI